MQFRDVRVVPSKFAEDLDKSQYLADPVQYVRDTSLYKAKAVVRTLGQADEIQIASEKDMLIICADTVVLGPNKRIYEKPKSREAQLRNLKIFCYECSDPVKVVTAVTIIHWRNKHDHSFHTFHDETDVDFDPEIPESIVEKYVASGDGDGVAGGFKIQGPASVMIRGVQGCYYNVVGLPLNKTFKALLNTALHAT